jgi:hypothetical protein
MIREMHNAAQLGSNRGMLSLVERSPPSVHDERKPSHISFRGSFVVLHARRSGIAALRRDS